MIINWFPGHMVKARRLIAENLKLVDAVCEIIDARIPLSSRNPDLDELIGGKPRLIALNRIDQADPAMNGKWSAFFKSTGEAVIETDSKSGKGIQQLQTALRQLLSGKIDDRTAKGQSGRVLRLMVTGIPNVGKSSFINRAAKRKAAPASDKPGVTRGKQWICLGGGIELLDTPGVLWPKLADQTVAENLAFTGAIRDEVMDLETLSARLLFKLAGLYPDCLTQRYKIDPDFISSVADLADKPGAEEGGFELLAKAAGVRGFITRGGGYDMQRMAAVLLDEFRGGKLGRITLEKPDSQGIGNRE